MVEGIGIDIVELKRIQQTVELWGEDFLRKIFTERELAYSQSKKNQLQHIAARFAVKEAVAKAITKGWSDGFRWKDVEVENEASGKPSVVLYGRMKEQLDKRKIHITISHSESVVVAFAIIES